MNNFTNEKTKYITFTVPCYNSANYMKKCVDSLLVGGDDIEIIIVNDGSTDNTAVIANEYAASYPHIIRVIHKENGGHGSGVNCGIEHATGIYFKVVDSDDWLDTTSYLELLKNIKQHVDKTKDNSNTKSIDLFITNYVYDMYDIGSQKAMSFDKVFPKSRLCTWADMKTLGISQYFMMHTLTYRTEILQKSGMQLPEHTFYVDNIYAYQPLPYVEHLMYLDLNLYHYYIGRPDQSVCESNLIKRVDQQLRVTNIVMNCHDIEAITSGNPELGKYMLRMISLLTSISTIICTMSDSESANFKKRKMWEDIKINTPELYWNIRCNTLNLLTNLPSKLVLAGYRYAKKKYMFAA